MKKNWKIALIAGLSLLTLTACKTKEGTTSETSHTSKTNSTLTSETSKSQSGEIVFRGKLSADATENADGVRLPLMETKAVVDPEEVITGIGSEGVILNAELSQLPADFNVEEYRTGVEVEVTLAENPVMTRSLPPQIPGASIVSIKKLAD